MPFVLRMFGQPADGLPRAALLRRALAFFGLALIAVTWRLWTPQQVFPQVPLFGFARALPAWCDWLGAGGMIAGLTVALIWPPTRRGSDAGLLIFAAGTALMAVLDQGRLQPWAYQFLLMAIVLALADARSALALLRLFVVSFYFHSALSKFDYTFIHTLGQQFLAALVGAFGLTLDAWSEESRLAAAMVFPAAELAVALGLCFARTRTAALAGAITLHSLLLVILGPAGLGHKPGVLVWNVYFIVQDLLLFGGLRRLAAIGSSPQPVRPFVPHVPWYVRAMMWAAVLLPFLAPTTWFDTWPSWGLYAPSAERVVLYVHRRSVGNLPQDLLPFLDEPDDPHEPWHRLRLDRWALEALGAPIYPQSRYQLGVAREIVARYAPVHRARVVRFDLADRFTGRRTHEAFASLPQLVDAGDEYYFNTGPRQAMFQPFPAEPEPQPRVKSR